MLDCFEERQKRALPYKLAPKGRPTRPGRFEGGCVTGQIEQFQVEERHDVYVANAARNARAAMSKAAVAASWAAKDSRERSLCYATT
jgi:hypothetical protein